MGLRALPALLPAAGDQRHRRVRRGARLQRPAAPGARTGHQPAVPDVLRGRAAGRASSARRTSTAPSPRGSPPGSARSTAAVACRWRDPSCTRPCVAPTSRSARAASPPSCCSTASASRACATRTVPGNRVEVTAGRVVLASGAFNSPQLLQLSGIGNAAELGALGIPVVARPARRGGAPAGPHGGQAPAQLHPAGHHRRDPEPVALAALRAAVAVHPPRHGAPRTSTRRAGWCAPTPRSPTRTCCSGSRRSRCASTRTSPTGATSS